MTREDLLKAVVLRLVLNGTPYDVAKLATHDMPTANLVELGHKLRVCTWIGSKLAAVSLAATA